MSSMLRRLVAKTPLRGMARGGIPGPSWLARQDLQAIAHASPEQLAKGEAILAAWSLDYPQVRDTMQEIKTAGLNETAALYALRHVEDTRDSRMVRRAIIIGLLIVLVVNWIDERPRPVHPSVEEQEKAIH